MFLSKIWFVLVGLVAGMAVAAAFVAPRSADRRIAELEGQRLDRAQYAAEQMLKNDAHRWINYAAKLSRDAVVTEALDNASGGRGGDVRLLNESLKRRLKALVPDLAGPGIEAVVAVDSKGRVVARIGDKENEFGENIGGAEAVADALRGYLSDDVWGSGGRLQRIAAVPVLSKGRDRIVGALYVAAETGKRLAELWKKNLGVEIAILLRGQPVAATMPEAAFASLGSEIESRSSEIAEAKRTQPIPLEIGGVRHFAVAAPFVGQASAQDGYFALVARMAPAADPLALLSSTTRDDLRWGNFPWLGLIGAVLLMVGTGVFLQRWEVERPLAKLRAEVQQLARGEVAKLQDTTYPGKFGGIARDVNAAIERITDASAPKSEIAKKDLGAILGPAPGEAGSVFDLPQSHFGGGLAPASPFASPPGARTPPPVSLGGPGAPMPSSSPFAPPPSRTPPPASPPFGPPTFGGPPPLTQPGPLGSYGRTPPPVATPQVPPAARYGATPQARLSSPPLSRPQTPAPVMIPPPMPPRTTAPSPPPAARVAGSATALLGPAFPGLLPDQPLPPLGSRGGEQAAGAPPVDAFAGDERTPSLRAETLGTGAPPRGATLEIRAVDGSVDSGSERDPRVPAIATDPAAGPAAEEAHVREVFDAYVATRQKCGEPPGSLTLEKFRDKLAANRQQLIAKYGCRTARFSVYVKDGKAAIKASPIR